MKNIVVMEETTASTLAEKMATMVTTNKALANVLMKDVTPAIIKEATHIVVVEETGWHQIG